MAETEPDTAPETSEPPNQAEELPGLNLDLAKSIAQALDDGDDDAVSSLVDPLHYVEIATLLEQMHPESRRMFVEHQRSNFDPEILPELDENVRNEVAEILGINTLSTAMSMLESDDALNLLSTLEDSRRDSVMAAVPAAVRAALAEGLNFPEDSAGRLMQRNFVAVAAFWTVGETIDFLRDSVDLPNDFYDVFIVDPGHRPIGTVTLSRILRSKRPVQMSEIMQPETLSVPVTMDQEEVAYIFSQYDLVSAPVIDDGGRLIGVIMVDDVVDVIHEEAEEDFMRLGGVREDDLYAAVLDTGRSRFSWLFVNLGTALLASIVIGFFQGTIEQIVMLAVLMPIAASMGGNAGTQTLTVVVRAIAMKEITGANAGRVISKEILVGIFNGMLFAVIIGAAAWFWTGDLHIGLVMAAAIIVTMIVAGLAGTAIPLGLSRTGIDPAVASGVFLTTITDVVAFCAFLGLASLFLL
jgi:magnesium transporter